MIFFPTIYEDELLYSVIARYHMRSSNTNLIYSLEELFSDKSVRVNIELPGNINKLISNLPINCKYTENDFIFKTTLYPFYTFFNSRDFSEELFSLMLDNDNNDVQIKSGLKAMSIDKPTYFRFCEECMKEDYEKYGEYYWHRIHQVSGVLLCPKHKTILHNSSVKLRSYNLREYKSPNIKNCQINGSNNYSEEISEKLYQLSKDIEFILNMNLDKKDEFWYWNNYRNSLMKRDLATLNGNILVKELIKKFKNFYGDEFLDLIQCNLKDEGYNNWLLDMIRKPRKRSHPIRHLLMIRFLGYDIRDFIQDEIKYKPFGEGSWPCMNKVCIYYKENVISNVSCTSYKKDNKIVGEFECSCGFKYSRQGPDENNENIYKITKIQDYGDVWRDKLEQLVTIKSYTVKEIAEILGVDRGTVYRHAKKLGLPIYERISNNYEVTSNNESYNYKDTTKEIYRKRWFELVVNNPNKSKTELRRIDDAAYTWLNKNDKEWLNKNSPLNSKLINLKSNVDWSKRDKYILDLIEISLKNINYISTNKPNRITISYISRLIDKPLGYYLSTNKMPKTKEYIDSILEDTDTFRKRKIKWAIYSFNSKNEEVTVSKVQQLLGFPISVRNSYEDYIRQCILDIV